MTAKFGFQVTVEQRTIWFFPEDVNLAEGVAKAEAAVKEAIREEIDKLKAGNVSDVQTLFQELPPEAQAKVNDEIKRLTELAKKKGETLTEPNAKVAALKNCADLVEANLTQITKIAEGAKKQINMLKEKLKTGVSYGWTRGAGEDPISLGTFEDLLNFIDEKIIKKLGIKFDTSDSFAAMVNGLPSPINGAIADLTTKAIFELDGIRLRIPGKESTLKDKDGNVVMDKDNKPKLEPTQFEIAMLVNLVPLNLDLGPFQLNRVYAKLGNFGSAEPAVEAGPPAGSDGTRS